MVLRKKNAKPRVSRAARDQGLGGNARAYSMPNRVARAGRPDRDIDPLLASKGAASESGFLAGQVTAQLVDPCSSEAVSIPDRYHGRVEFVSVSETQQVTGSTDAGSAGSNHIIIAPETKNKFSRAGGAAWGTYTFKDGLQQTAMAADYAYIRAVGMCARITKTSAATTPNGTLLAACVKEGADNLLTYASSTAVHTFLLANQAQQVVALNGFEMSWCPQSQDDFVPHAPGNSAEGASQDVGGRLLSSRPALHFHFDGLGTTAEYLITVTTRYECFLVASKQVRGQWSQIQDTSAMDKMMSAIRSVNWMRTGDGIEKVGGYAGRVAAAFNPVLGRSLIIGTKAINAALHRLAY